MGRGILDAAASLAAIAVALPSAAVAQTSAPPEAAQTPTPAKRSYTPADFARFAPRTAFDMLAQVPGFTIREADGDRGLGQASENVLINGQRIANKSGGAVAELRRVPAPQVERIEIVDAASLGLAGLTGEVANVVVRPSTAVRGQFEWQPGFRAHYTRPNLFGGTASLTGRNGAVDYTLSVENSVGRGGYGGPVLLTDAAGARLETRDGLYHGEYSQLSFKTRFGFDLPGTATAALTLSVGPRREDFYDRERRVRSDGDNRIRLTQGGTGGALYSIDGNVDLPVGPGRLKLIGVRSYDHQPRLTTQVTRFDSGAAPTGIRLDRDGAVAETIGRAEYSWTGGRNAWQLSGERAFNSLRQDGRLATLSPAGAFVPVPYPDGSGRVEEVRYEGTGTLSRPLSPRLDLQLVIGAEQSRLARVDGDVPARRFFRPKGSASLGWRPARGWDASLKLSRRVGQIDFYDFLAQPNLQQDRQNAGNPDLVPPQSWELDGEGGRDLGRWGKTRLKLFYNRVEDIIDIVPVGLDGEGVGNLPTATRFGAESTSTIQFDPLGYAGAKLDATIGFNHSRVRDPLTGLARPISGTRDAFLSLEFRRDVPRSPLAWGGGVDIGHNARGYRLGEIFNSREGPVFDSLFIEHKNVLGLTVRAQVVNLLDARHRLDRDVYDGRRTVAPLAYRLHAEQLIGPLFNFRVSGSF